MEKARIPSFSRDAIGREPRAASLCASVRSGLYSCPSRASVTPTRSAPRAILIAHDLDHGVSGAAPPSSGPRRGIAVADSIATEPVASRARAARRASAAPRRAASISRRVRNAHARGSMTREAASDARSRLTRAPSRRPRPSPRRFSLSTRPCWPRYASARRDVAPRARSNPPSRVESVARRAEPPGKTTRGGFLTRQRGGVRIGFPAMPGARVRRAIAPLATPTLTFPPPPSVPDPPPPPFPRLPSPPSRAAPLA